MDDQELMNEPVYTIGLAADKLGIAVPTLRMYEQAGLIIPHRTKTGRRVYSRNDIRRVQVIMDLIRVKKLNLEAVKMLCSLTPCWTFVGCPEDIRENCPAFSESSAPCWLTPANCSFKTLDDCRLCAVYLKCMDTLQDPKGFLKELLRCDNSGKRVA